MYMQNNFELLHYYRNCNQKCTPARVGKYRDILENIQYFLYIYIYQAFAHTLLKLYEIYYQIIVCVCVCALYIR